MRPLRTPHMRQQRPRLAVRWTAVLAALALALAACSPDEIGDDAESDEADAAAEDDAGTDDAGTDDVGTEDWPTDSLRVVVVSGPGGGFDASIRQLEPMLSERLGVNIEVENEPGGSTAVGTTLVHRAEPDCSTVLLTGIPHLIFTDLTQDVDYTFEDFHPVGQLTTEPALFRVANDAPWDTMEDLLEDARANPGELRASVGFFTNNYYLSLLELQELADVEFNIVAYEGGADARNALAAGEVELTSAGVYNSRNVEEETRVLALHYDENIWGNITDDAPPLYEALGLDADAVSQNDSSYGLFVPQACEDEHPERRQILEDAVADAVQDPAYQELLAELQEEGKSAFIPGDEYDQLNRAAYDDIAAVVAERSDEFQQ